MSAGRPVGRWRRGRRFRSHPRKCPAPGCKTRRAFRESSRSHAGRSRLRPPSPRSGRGPPWAACRPTRSGHRRRWPPSPPRRPAPRSRRPRPRCPEQPRRGRGEALVVVGTDEHHDDLGVVRGQQRGEVSRPVVVRGIREARVTHRGDHGPGRAGGIEPGQELIPEVDPERIPDLEHTKGRRGAGEERGKASPGPSSSHRHRLLSPWRAVRPHRRPRALAKPPGSRRRPP